MEHSTQADELDGLDVPQLNALATALGIEFTPKARAQTLVNLIRHKRERDARREADRPAREAAAHVEEERQNARERAFQAEHEARQARAKQARKDPELRAEIIDRRAAKVMDQADRVRRFVRGNDPALDCSEHMSAAEYLDEVQANLAEAQGAIRLATASVSTADALRDGLASKLGRQAVAAARLRLAEAEHELASARLFAMTTSDPPQAPRRRGIVLKRSLSAAAP